MKNKLSHVVEIISGGTPKTSVSEYWNGEIGWLSVVDFGDKNKYVETSEKTITEEGVNSSSTKILAKNDIIISARGTVGAMAMLKKPMAFNQSCFGIRAKADYLNQDFLFYYLKYYMKNIKAKTQGSVFDTINLSTFDMLEIDYPEMNIQNRIAYILSLLDNKIENNNKIREKLEKVAKMVYDYWFLQFEFPNKDGKPYKSSGGKMIWNEKLKREIPEGWKVDSLGDLFTSNRGISYDSKSIEGDGIPMINLASFNIDGSYKEEGIKTYSGQYTEDKIVKPFDLLMCNTQQTAIDYEKDIIGKAFLVPDIFEGDIVTSHHVTTIQVKNENMKYFLHRLFNTEYFHRYVAGYTNGTNILGLIFSGIEKYQLEIPDDFILNNFSELMANIEMKKSKIIKENQKLILLRDFLLPLLMNGQVVFKA